MLDIHIKCLNVVVQNNRFLVRLTSTLQAVDPKLVESTQVEQSRNKAGELQLAERALHRATTGTKALRTLEP